MKPHECPACSGNGERKYHEKWDECRSCKGKGIVWEPRLPLEKIIQVPDKPKKNKYYEQQAEEWILWPPPWGGKELCFAKEKS